MQMVQFHFKVLALKEDIMDIVKGCTSRDCTDCNVRCMVRKEDYKPKKKPPIGVMPRYLWVEQRQADLSLAIRDYTLQGWIVPTEWIEEFNYIVRAREETLCSIAKK